MKPVLFLSLFVVSLFLFASSAQAATYYVATTGSDSNTAVQAQSSSTPWLTLQHANDNATVANGDTIHVAVGTYAAASFGINVTKSLTWIADGVVTIQAGAGTYPALISTTNVTFTGSGANGFIFDAQNLRSYAAQVYTNNSGASFTNCTFENATAKLLQINSGASTTVDHSTFSLGQDITGAQIDSTAHVSVTNSTFNSNGHSFSDLLLVEYNSTGSTYTFSGNIATITSTTDSVLSLAGAGTYTLSNNNFTITNSSGSFLDFGYPSQTDEIDMTGNTVNYSGKPGGSIGAVVYSHYGTNNILNVTGNNNITVSDATYDKTVFRFASQAITTITGNTFTFAGLGLFLKATIPISTTLTFTGNTVGIATTTINNGANSTGDIFDVDGSGTFNLGTLAAPNTFNMTNSAAIFANIGSGGGVLATNMINNTISYSGKPGFNLISSTAGANPINISSNSITVSDASYTNTVIVLQNQPTPTISGNTIDSAGNDELIDITSTGTTVGAVAINSNTFRSRHTSNYIIKIGSENTSSGSTDNKIDGLQFMGNTIYGDLYFNPTHTTDGTHGLMYGLSRNATISNNKFIGAPLAVVLKHLGISTANYSVWTSGGFFNNYIQNAIGESGFEIKGAQNVPVYNNVFSINSANPNNVDPAILMAWSNDGGSTNNAFGTGSTWENNIFDISNSDSAHNITPTLLGIDVSGEQTGMVSNYNIFYRNDGGTSVASIAGTGKIMSVWQGLGYDANGQYADPQFVNPASSIPDFDLQASSTAIDAGTTTPNMTSTSTDLGGNPIYGVPDIGAYEYQPPYSLTVVTPGTMDTGAGARIYADGKFRNLATTTSSVPAHLKVAPLGGNFVTYDASTTRPAWLDVTGITNWSNSHKTWIESNSASTTMVTDHTIGDLDSSKYYTVTATGALASNISGINGTTCSLINGNTACLSNGSGSLSFEYNGGYSTHTFDMSELGSTKTITAFDFAGLAPVVNGVVTEGSHTIAVTVPYGTDLITLVPTITFTGSSTSPLSGVAQDFTSPVVYTVTAVDNTTQPYTVTVTALTDTTPPTPGIITFSGITQTSITATTTGTTDNGPLAVAPFRYHNVTTDTYTAATSTAVTFTGLTANTSYTFEVAVEDAAGNWATSTQYTTTTSAVSVSVTTINSHGNSNNKINPLFYQQSVAPVVTPSVAPSFPTFTLNLSAGNTSNAVRFLQNYLNTHGYLVAEAGAGSLNHETNYFGPATKAALIKFQKDNNIFPATGDFGPRTRALINSDTTPATMPALLIEQPSISTSFTRDLEKGMRGDDVKLLQVYLNTHGYVIASTGGGSLGNETTLFGLGTKAALIKFQKANHISPAVGFFGPVTRKYINTH